MAGCWLLVLLVGVSGQAVPEIVIGSIRVVCERSEKAFCGEYLSKGDGFEMTKNGTRFQIKNEGKEFCLLLQNDIKLCGRQHVDELIKVQHSRRSIQNGYIMEFTSLESDSPEDVDSDYVCNPDDIYSDCSDNQPAAAEISGGKVAAQNSLPFIVRLHIQGTRGIEGTCGGSLIHPKYVLSALHCFRSEFASDGSREYNFPDGCFRRGNPNNRCYATIRDHYVNSLDPGEVRINIADIFPASEGTSDLVVVELEREVNLDENAKLIEISEKPLEPGDLTITAGWGFTGRRGPLSNVLRRTELKVSVGGTAERIETEVGTTRTGQPIDTCGGDSGGPLLKWSSLKDAFLLFATVFGGGFNCKTGGTVGGGKWNSVFPHREWVKAFIRGKSGARHRPRSVSIPVRRCPASTCSARIFSCCPARILQHRCPQVYSTN